MTKQVPDAVVTPRSAKEVAGVVRCASREGIRLAIRGGGHSQGGQSLTDCGVVLDTRRLDRVQRVSSGLVRAQGGARWSQVLDALRGTRRLPRVLADTGDVTVGGTLSAGGVGSTSHRHGAQAGQVERLEVVTGTGERVRCSPSRNEGLFNAVRGGQGQFGIVTEAWIRLRAAGKRFRQHQLLYRDYDRFADDFEYVVEADRFDHLRAEIRCHEREILLCAGFEHAGEPDDEAVLAGLQYDENIYGRPRDASVLENGFEGAVRCCHLSGLFVRHVIIRWPVWRYADRVQITSASWMLCVFALVFPIPSR